MDCDKALKEIELFLDGELPPPDVEEVGAHLKDCPPCGERAEFQRRLKYLLAAKCCDEVPASLRTRIAAILERGPAGTESPDAR
jgi:mycothiol system anti-sigma-R factor